MHYYEGDTPGAVSVVPASVQNLTGLSTATAVLTRPDGVQQTLAGTKFDGTTIVVTLPTLDVLGVYVLSIALTGNGRSVSLESARIPVEAPDGGGWYTLDAARREWPGAPEDDARLFDLLASARLQVTEYAPDLDGAAVPVNYRAAELLQARNIWNASQTDPNGGQMNADGYSVPVYPLDWTVKQMLRPKRAVPVVA